ncbi:MAG TPA: hypothetical protein VHC00_21310 [Rhizobiaceae bacterium]|nr:hypothetical protein [Rhizobiaceae bacterium]
MVVAMMVIPVIVIAVMAVDRIQVPVMARLDQYHAVVVVMMVTVIMVVVMVPIVVMSMAGFDHYGLSAGGARQKQDRNPGKQKLLH